MFLKKISDLRQSLSVRLTFWYAVVFSVSSLVVLMIFCQQVLSMAVKRMDEELLEDIGKYSDLLKSQGIERLTKELADEVASEDETKFFIQLQTNYGQTLISSDLTSWVSGDLVRIPQNPSLYDEKPILQTLEVQTKPFKVRVITGRVDPTRIMRIGISLEENQEYLDIFQRLILMLLFPVLIGATVVGWFMAKQALGDVEQITQTAERITEGDYDERVVVRKKSREINRLAHTFNQMVDKLHALIRGMREITDNIAHDLRSPLTRIRGIAEMNLMGRKSREDFEIMAANTIEECDNMIHLINTMLEITETEAGLDQGVVESVDLTHLIGEACELFHQLAQQKRIVITANRAEPVLVRANKARLQRLIANLLENAIKYTPEAGSVSIYLTRSESTISFHVKDTGIGIAPSDLPKIFDRFYRCDASRTESGFGLGLSLAKAIADAMGGTLHVNSTLHKGTEFILTMPA